MLRYWTDFYKEGHIKIPSDFAKFCLDFLKPCSFITDLGCGNGRDSYYFAANNHIVTGIDYANMPKNTTNAFFIKGDILEHQHVYKDTICYSRFFLHSVTNEYIEKLLDTIKSTIMFEFRTIEDTPLIYKHNRNLINSDKFLSMLLDKGFKIQYFNKGKDLAKFKNENPIVARVIANL